MKLPIRSKSIFSTNIEELYQLGAASIHPKKNFNKFKEIFVKKKKLDEFKINNKIGFIKIDVEGHEIEVIDGAKKTILDNMPVLLVEIEERHSQISVEKSVEYIKKFGYQCFFVKDENLVSFNNITDTKSENNYFFIPKN